MLNFTKPKTMVLGSVILILLTALSLAFNRIDINTGEDTYDAYSILFVFAALFIFLSGYSILWIAKKETQRILSIFNFVFLINSVLFFIAGLYTMTMIMAFFSIQMNITNMFFGFAAKTNSKKKN